VSSEGTGAPGPDFTLTHSASGRIVRVEVFSYPPRPDNEKKLGPMVKEYFIDGRLGLCSSAMQISVQDPFGFPDLNKPGDSTTANSISKICDRKSSEKQLSGDEISVLYFDLQSLWISTSMIEQAQPILFSPDGVMTSGAIWHAFYGKTGYPIFENASECKKTRFDCVRMQHDGHFQSKSASKANALIVAVGYKSGNSKFKRLICLENPLRPLPEDVFVSLIESTMFDRMNSRMGSTLLGELIDDRKLVSECLDRYASWHPGSTQGMRVDA